MLNPKIKSEDSIVSPISQVSLPDKIVHEILRRIRTGEWPPGHALPRQRDLAKTLQVSLSSLREAIGTLMAMGFLETKRGQGTFVRNSNGNWIVPGKFAGVYIDSPQTLTEFIEARLALEETTAKLAAQRRTDEEVRILQNILKTMEEALSDPDEYRTLDGVLHFRVAEMSRNSILEKMYKGLHNLISDYIQAVPDPTAGFEWHVRLVDAIARGNPDDAVESMRRSLYVDRELQEALEKQTSNPQ